MTKYEWNGQPCKARFLNIEILPTEITNLAWWKPYEGTVRQVIEITSWGEPFLIDNEDGLGYAKITNGGMWTKGSRHYDCNYQIVSSVDSNEVIKEFSSEVYSRIEADYQSYWSEKEPQRLERLNQMIANPPNFSQIVSTTNSKK